MNRTPKETLAKFHQETGLPWMDLLPLALFRVRNAPNPSRYTPYELVLGRPPTVLSLPRGELRLQGELVQARYLQQLGRTLDRIAKARLGGGPQPRGGGSTLLQAWELCMDKRLEKGTPPTHVDWASPNYTDYPDCP